MKRIEKDSFGDIEVLDEYYWGAQTQRSLKYFHIGSEKMPMPVIYALALIKKAAAMANNKLRLLNDEYKNAIVHAADLILSKKMDSHFPLSLWQTGSGTQSNMNVNEVISNIANEFLGGTKGSKAPIHPNDHVNMGQSSNDCFPTAMHMASIIEISESLIPALTKILIAVQHKVSSWSSIVKVGRTHLQDATPITLGQEFSGYAAAIEFALDKIKGALEDLYYLAQGGTAVGTGLNTHVKFAEVFIEELNSISGYEFKTAPNKFRALSSCDALVGMSGCLNLLASTLNKIACDIRLMGSGPRCGFGELLLPENEPGSSIMPGKVNPTQCEALSMVAAQVMGNHASITIAGSNGHFELNVYRPVLIYNLLQSVYLLADSCNSFTDHCLVGLEPNIDRIHELNHNSLMLVTALSPHIGYDNAAKIAKEAHKCNISLKAAAMKMQLISEKDFDKYMDINKMV